MSAMNRLRLLDDVHMTRVPVFCSTPHALMSMFEHRMSHTLVSTTVEPVKPPGCVENALHARMEQHSVCF